MPFCGGKLVGNRNKPFHHPSSNIRYLIDRKLSRRNHRIIRKIEAAKTFLEGSKEYAGAGFDGLRAVFGHF